MTAPSFLQQVIRTVAAAKISSLLYIQLFMLVFLGAPPLAVENEQPELPALQSPLGGLP